VPPTAVPATAPESAGAGAEDEPTADAPPATR
jgi:hypothetical protein